MLQGVICIVFVYTYTYIDRWIQSTSTIQNLVFFLNSLIRQSKIEKYCIDIFFRHIPFHTSICPTLLLFLSPLTSSNWCLRGLKLAVKYYMYFSFKDSQSLFFTILTHTHTYIYIGSLLRSLLTSFLLFPLQWAQFYFHSKKKYLFPILPFILFFSFFSFCLFSLIEMKEGVWWNWEVSGGFCYSPNLRDHIIYLSTYHIRDFLLSP